MPEATSVGPYDPKEWVSNIFSVNPSGEGLSYEQLKQRRAIAAALASRARPYPTTIGQGLTALGEGFADAMYEQRTQEYEKQQRDLDRRAREDAGGLIPPPPAAKRTSDLAVPSEVQKTAAALEETPNPVSTMVADDRPVPRADVARTVLARQGVIPPGGAPAALPGLPPSQPLAGPAPMNTRYAALNTGTMSDAGQPGATYGGPPPAGPGASTAEPPVENPPAPSALPTAPPGPVGTPAPGVAGGGPGPVPRAALAGPVLAQAGVTPPVPARAPARVAPPVAPETTIRAAPGTLTQPPAAGAPAPSTYPAFGQTPTMEPRAAEPRPPQPLIGQDTPAMARIKATLANPAYRDMSPMQREQLTQTYQRMKGDRDKQDAENLDAWKRKDADWFTREQKRIEENQNLPKTRLELSEKTDAETIRRRWGTPERKKTAEEAADKSGDAARSWAGALPQIYKAMDLVKQDKVLGGFLAGEMGVGPGGGWVSAGSPKLMGSKVMTEMGLGNWSRPIGKSGPPRTYQEEVAATEEYQGLLRGIVAANLKAYGGNPSTADLKAAEAQYGLSLGLDNESKLRILNNIKNEYLAKIQEHHSRLGKEFNVPEQDRATLERNQVEVQHDPSDVERLRAALRSGGSEANVNETINRFDRIYGPGEARKALMMER